MHPSDVVPSSFRPDRADVIFQGGTVCGGTGLRLKRFSEVGTGVHDVPDEPKSVWDIRLEKREDVIDRRRVFQRGEVDGYLRLGCCLCGFLLSRYNHKLHEPHPADTYIGLGTKVPPAMVRRIEQDLEI